MSLKNRKGVTQDRTLNLRSDSQWSNEMSYRATITCFHMLSAVSREQRHGRGLQTFIVESKPGCKKVVLLEYRKVI